MSANEKSMQVSQFINSERGKVFQSWTDHELVRKWLCPEECSVLTSEAEVSVGGFYRESMKCGENIHTVFGTYREIVPGRKLVFTHQWEESESLETLVVVDFSDKNSGCEVTVSQKGFTSIDSAKGHEQGWASALRNLARQFPK